VRERDDAGVAEKQVVARDEQDEYGDLGGVMWAMYQESLTAGMGMQVMVVIFIVIIIGGLGSVGGCFVGALLVGLMANYIGYVAPKLALGSNILLMVLILLWRPRGLYPVGK